EVASALVFYVCWESHSSSDLLFTVIILCSSFIVLLFARHQTLLDDSSKLKLRLTSKIVFYIYTFASFLVIPIVFCFFGYTRR
ncbi:hypothetical protein PENTCL1PPCAC_1609, partial [Pristionchus entomophagus]